VQVPGGEERADVEQRVSDAVEAAQVGSRDSETPSHDTVEYVRQKRCD
jgi:hypothetical protein